MTGVSDTPRLDSELLMAHALGIERDALLLNPPPETKSAYKKLEREFFLLRDQLATNRDQTATTKDGIELTTMERYFLEYQPTEL